MNKYLSNRFSSLNPLVVFYYFSLTALIMRLVIFWAWTHGHYPAVYMHGWHIHHFFFGFLFLLWSLWALSEGTAPRWFLEITFGVAAGLIFDEFIFWSMYRFEYWSMGNFYALVLGAGLVGLLSLKDGRAYTIRIKDKTKPDTIYSFRKHVVLPWVSFALVLFFFFGFYNPDLIDSNQMHKLQIRSGISEEHAELSGYITNKIYSIKRHL